MGRAPCCPEENGMKKGPWTAEEDEKLSKFIREKGHGSWRALPRLAGINRCGKSCRLRWMNYLRPDIKRGNFSEEEERLIIHFHSIVGNKWAKIAAHLPGRTDNEVKNHWNTHLRKKLLKEGIDPTTHQPIPNDHVPYDLLVNLITAQSLCGPSNLHTNPGSSSISSSPWEQIIATELTRIQLVDNVIRLICPKAPPVIDCLTNTHTVTPLLGGSCHNTISSSALQNINILNANPLGNLQHAVESSMLSEQALPLLDAKDCAESEGKGSAPTAAGSSSFTKSSIGSMDMFEDLENLMVDDTCASFLKDFLE